MRRRARHWRLSRTLAGARAIGVSRDESATVNQKDETTIATCAGGDFTRIERPAARRTACVRCAIATNGEAHCLC